jgi:hypothetical protein
MPVPKTPVPPLAYELTNNPLPFSRGTWFRWEKAKLIPPLLRIGGKTLVQATTIAAIISGEIKLPANSGRLKRPEPLDRGGHAKRRKAKAEPETTPAHATE